MIAVVVSTVVIYGSLMPLVAYLVLGEREELHKGPKIQIKSGRTFEQRPENPEH